MESPASSSPQRLSPWYNEFVPCIGQDKLLSSNMRVETLVLCSKCEPIRAWLAEHWTRLETVDQNFEQVFDHYDDSRLLEPSALRGCHLCTLFWHNFDPKFFPRAGRLAEREKLHREIRNGRQVQVIAYNKGLLGAVLRPSLLIPDSESLSGESTPLRLDTYFQLHPEPDVPITISSLHISTTAPAVTKLAKAWITECTTSHPKCARKRTSTLPTRLVDGRSLGPVGKVKTVETDRMDLNIQYVALSYCWGSKPTFKLKKSTRKSLTSGVAVQRLPKSIQDAIYFTQSIGLAWLWIDSLCIIQDSEEDWNREASTMCDVYQGSYLTLAALGAVSSEEGLFAVRDPLLYSPCFMFQKNRQQKIYAGQDSTIGAVLDPWPLHQRGWVTQERILPPRTLNFGPYLIWQCQEKTLDEYNIIARSSYSYRYAFQMNSDFCEFVIDSAVHDMPSATRDKRILSNWQQIVESYSRGNLAVMTDRLTAISGIIAAVQRRTGWTNLSGLWGPFLWHQLLWQKLFDPSPKYTGLLPSWSWISVNGAIYWQQDVPSKGFLMNSVAHVKRIGDVTPSHTGRTRNSGTRMALEIFCMPGRVDAICESEPIGPLRNVVRANLTNWPIAGHGAYRPDIPSTDREPELFLPIGAGSWDDSGLEIRGLAVSPSKTCDGAFERVGFFTVSANEKLNKELQESNYALLHDLNLRERIVLV